MKKNIVLLAVTALVLALAAPALADVIFDGDTDNDWNTAANWNPDGVPTTASGFVIVDASNTVDISANAPDINGLRVNGGAHLTINANLALTVTSADILFTSGGIITQNAGDVSVNDDMRFGNGKYYMKGGTFDLGDYIRFDPTTAPDLVAISGGSFTIGGVFNINSTAATLQVIGDAATDITFGSLSNAAAGTQAFVLKDGGITTIDVTGNAAQAGTLDVTLDGFALPGIDTDYTLISAESLSGAFTTINLPSGDWSVANSGNDVVLSYTNPVPEPTSLSLLAIVGMGLMVKRRRRRA